MIKNTLYSSGQVIAIAVGETYTLKDDEVMINNSIYRKIDLEIGTQGNQLLAIDDTVYLSIRKRTSRINLPAFGVKYYEWEIDGVQQISLSNLIENISRAITPQAYDNFKIKVDTSIVDDTPAGQFTVNIATQAGTIDFDVFTSDGQSFLNQTGSFIITFPDSGIYDVEYVLRNATPRFYNNDDSKVIEHISWGVLPIIASSLMFRNCSNMPTISTVDLPLGLEGNSTGMFQGCSALEAGNFAFDISGVTRLEDYFLSCDLFNQDITGWDVSGVGNFDSMLRAMPNFDQDLSGWNISSATNFTNFLRDTTLSTANYDALLISWEAQAPNTGLNFHGGNSTFTLGGEAEAARQSLIDTYTWNITDGGGVSSAISGGSADTDYTNLNRIEGGDVDTDYTNLNTISGGGA